MRIVVAAAVCTLVVPALPRAQTPAAPIVGVWMLDKDLSDTPPAPADGGQRERGGRSGGGRGRGRGGFGGGGLGRGTGARGNAEDMQRRREAMRNLLDAPQRMTITQTDAMVIITTGDGLTTRLETDNKKVKDDSTGIERKSRWESGKLVSEISGLGPGKISEIYEVDAEKHQLTVTLEFEGGGTSRPPVHRVYDTAS
jgi:hypothetical protein